MISNFIVEYHLYDLLEQKALNARELETLSGISKTEINRIENGKANPTVNTICALSLALKVRPCDLFSIRISP